MLSVLLALACGIDQAAVNESGLSDAGRDDVACARELKLTGYLAGDDGTSYVPGPISDGSRIAVAVGELVGGLVQFEFLVQGAGADDGRSFDARVWLADRGAEDGWILWKSGRLIQDKEESCPVSDWPQMTKLDDAPVDGVEEPRELIVQLTFDGDEPVEWSYDVTLVPVDTSNYD
ncbi:hypothetical protein L6R53_29235 [Myxococcota bacterium]|nr:hypothetical protein [Myxococcota bacterium]